VNSLRAMAVLAALALGGLAQLASPATAEPGTPPRTTSSQPAVERRSVSCIAEYGPEADLIHVRTPDVDFSELMLPGVGQVVGADGEAIFAANGHVTVVCKGASPFSPPPTSTATTCALQAQPYQGHSTPIFSGAGRIVVLADGQISITCFLWPPGQSRDAVTGRTLRLPDGDTIVLDRQGLGHRLRAHPEIAAQLAALAGRRVTVVGRPLASPAEQPNYPLEVQDFRLERGGAFDGEFVSLAGPSRVLADGDVIVVDELGHGHRLFTDPADTALRAHIAALRGQPLRVEGTAVVQNTAARETWPIAVTAVSGGT
jgi:hypothetical protein